jgi:nucleotide-binding universal stress UspA family protein
MLAVNDSPAGLAAVRAAIAMAHRGGDRLHVLTVVDHHDRPATAAPSDRARVEQSADVLLHRVATLAEKAGVAVSTARRSGSVTSVVLDEAARVHADMIVVGLVDKPSHVVPAIGTHTLNLLEFADVPVLVVPRPVSPSATASGILTLRE